MHLPLGLSPTSRELDLPREFAPTEKFAPFEKRERVLLTKAAAPVVELHIAQSPTP